LPDEIFYTAEMEDNAEDLLTEIVQQLSAVKRKSLLLWWIKVFMWIFLAFGVFAPFGLIFAFFGFSFQLSLYGLDTQTPLSYIGICIILIFLFKGITSYGLLTEADWAIKICIVDAILGIAICVFVMLFPLLSSNSNARFSFRLELVLLIPYLHKLLNIRAAWENAIGV
jgi:hypothetical protein